MSDFRFAEPGWVHAFWVLIAFVAVLVYLERRGGSALERLVGSALRERLVRAPAGWRRYARIALVGLCLAASIVALMRPQWGLRYTSVSRASAEIMVCLDVSRSMLAEDVAPNRLERAKAEIVDLLSYLQGDRVGLIAFAGRASVLSPMTPDFGFLRLVLDSVGPGSVTRGGTRLEEPIRKAVEGFDPRGDAARVIVLITDGEDQDSFPLRAAAEAREAGVRIIAIGYGSEDGSPVYVSDPKTGARTLLRDPAGEAVTSRLDGEMLRDIVSETQGVYVPAGTGVLDLKSIYDQYLSDLLRSSGGGRGLPVREEGYQWAILLALIALVGSVVVSGQGRTAEAARGAGVTAALLWILVMCPVDSLRAQGEEAAGTERSTEIEPAVPTTAAEPAVGDEPAPEGAAAAELDPREIYNSGVAALESGELETAEQRLRSARSQGAQDPEVRFRATYNLGLATAQRADAARGSEPETALALYYEAADRFRDAVRQQPEDPDVRHNLEVVLRRALVLADELARQKQGGIEEQLGALIERQRAVSGRLAGTLAQRSPDPSYDADPAVRREYRSVAADQRVLLADADALARQVATERDALEAPPSAGAGAEPDPARERRRGQLGPLLEHLDAARERMGRARGQMRLQQGERAYRRTAAALTELKRALDALRNPVSVLEGIVQDAGEAGSWIAAWNGGRSQERAGAESTLPAWLTPGFIGDQQELLVERTEELAEVLRAGAEAPDADPVGVAEAVPLLARGAGAFREAQAAVQEYAGERALAAQVRGVQALLEARERFLELKGLIELVYGDERRIERDLAEPKDAQGDDSSSGLQDPDARRAQRQMLSSRNVARAERLAALLARERAALAAQPQDPSAPPDARAAAERRLELAGPALARASDDLRRADAELQRGAAALPAVRAAVQSLSVLRRLFFSVQELLRETTARQLELNDDTRDVGTLPDTADRAPRVDPLVARQSELAGIGSEIAKSLDEQASQSGPAAQAEPNAERASESLREAAEHVRAAETAMQEAIRSLDAAEPGFTDAAPSQAKAAEELAEALALLVPPEQQPKPEDSEPKSEPSQPNAGQNGSEPDARESAQDPGQTLQAVRDREAQRRRERAERAERSETGYETVERDW